MHHYVLTLSCPDHPGIVRAIAQGAGAADGNITESAQFSDPVTGLPRKMSFGPWMMKAFKVLAAFKPLRGTPLDVFGYTHERKMERQLIRDYVVLIDEIVNHLTAGNHATAIGLANIPQKIRGFGHIKERHLKTAKAEEAQLLARFRASEQSLSIAAE